MRLKDVRDLSPVNNPRNPTPKVSDQRFRCCLRCCSIVALVIVIVLFLRRPDAVAEPRFYAEDGSILFSDQFMHGPSVLLSPVAGYVFLIPRVVAEIVGLFPIAWAARMYALAALTISACCCAFFSLPRFRLIVASDLNRVVLCFIAAMALPSTEFIGVLVNTQWYLAIPGVLLLFGGLGSGTSATKVTIAVLIGLVLGLSAPQLVILLPLCVVFAIRSSGPLRAYAIGLGTAEVAQMIVYLGNSAALQGGTGGLLTVVTAIPVSIVYKVFLASMLGGNILQRAGGALPLAAAVTAVLAFGWLFALSLATETRQRTLFACYLIISSVALALLGRDIAQFYADPIKPVLVGVERYFYLASCAFAFLVFLTADRAVRWRRGATIMAVAVFGTAAVSSFSAPTLTGPPWIEYAAQIKRFRESPESFVVPELVLPIAPRGFTITLIDPLRTASDNLRPEVFARLGSLQPAVNADRIGLYRPADALRGPGTWVRDIEGVAAISSFGGIGTPVVGRWIAGAASAIGMFIEGLWVLDSNGDGLVDDDDQRVALGQAGDVPIVGNFNGFGRDTVAVFRAGIWLMDYNGNHRWDGPSVDRLLSLGQRGDIPLVGDWNGDGRSKAGVFRSGQWILDFNGNYRWDHPTVDRAFMLGQSGDTPVIGDWNGDGRTDIGIFRRGLWLLDFNGSGQWENAPPDRMISFGAHGDVPVTGDWNGDGRMKVGIFRPADGLWLLDVNGNGIDDSKDVRVNIGRLGDQPITGKWVRR